MEWAIWQTNLIRKLDPSAKIFIQTGDTRYFLRPGPQTIHEERKAITYMPEWMIMEALMQANVDFDGIAIESHHGTKDPGDWHQLEERIKNLTSYGREVFVWEIWYPSDYDPNVYFDWKSSVELTQHTPFQWPHSSETYTREWQRNQIESIMRMLVENPHVTGVSWFVLVDGYHDWGNASSGLIDSSLVPKPSYNALRSYWWSLFTQGRTSTDARGEAIFQGMAGEYDLTINSEDHEGRTLSIRVREVGPKEWTFDVCIKENSPIHIVGAFPILIFLRCRAFY